MEERLTRAEAIAARQHTGRTVAKGARDRRKELRHILHFQLLRYLTAVGSVAATTRADLAARFKLPHGNATNSSFVTSVKALIAVAEEQKELLVQEGMDAALLEDLKARVSEFEAALQTVLAARRGGAWPDSGAGQHLDTGRRRPGGVRGRITVLFPAALRDRDAGGSRG